MKNVHEIVRCKCCGAVLETVCVGKQDSCVGDAPWEALRINTVDGAAEKHLPVVEKKDGGVLVKVGSLPHPMAEDHYIQWIEIVDGRDVRRHHLAPGEAPEAFFDVELSPDALVRAYCNKHGLWKK
ncbi:MAG: hypothetical protein MJ016_08195 [Victivallaceae bacterium]|nr:hypothetical protein [Victivallaceae bacterium]